MKYSEMILKLNKNENESVRLIFSLINFNFLTNQLILIKYPQKNQKESNSKKTEKNIKNKGNNLQSESNEKEGDYFTHLNIHFLNKRNLIKAF